MRNRLNANDWMNCIQELLRRTVRAQELERQRIARELHDEIGQTLTALGMGLRAISDSASSKPERVNKQARELQGVVDTGLSGLQNLIMGLHPPQLDDFGLMAALRWFSAQVKDRFGLTVTVTSRGDETDLAEEVRTVLYRIVQESIINVIRHANADHADVLVVFDEDEVNIRVEDNGCGFDVDAALNQPGTSMLGTAWNARTCRSGGRRMRDPVHAGSGNAHSSMPAACKGNPWLKKFASCW